MVICQRSYADDVINFPALITRSFLSVRIKKAYAPAERTGDVIEVFFMHPPASRL